MYYYTYSYVLTISIACSRESEVYMMPTLKAGNLVLMKNMKTSHKMGGKLDICWDGPYEVTENCGKNLMRFRVMNIHSKKTLSHLRKWFIAVG